MSLWRKNDGPPRPLPFQDSMPDGTVYTDLANNPAGRAALGWVEGLVPELVSRMQFRVMLATLPPRIPSEDPERTLLDDFDEYLATLPRPQRELAQGASEYRRAHQLVAAVAAHFGMTEEEVDDLFIEAKTVE